MISVVIPTLDEAEMLPRLLSSLAAQAAEIIVVDGGSRDGTEAVARAHGARLLRAGPGRGTQLRRGAEVARGAVLLFLHADCVFPHGGLASIERCLAASPEVVGGNFRLVFEGDDAFSRWLTGFYGWIRERGFYYGDSGLFVRREVYRALGGIRPIALMEDYDFVRRLEGFGRTFRIADALLTSSRRFEGRGPAAIVCGWLLIHALFHMGVAPEWLARLYDSERRHIAALAKTL